MKDQVVELAKLFKERDNQRVQGACIGEIIAEKPYKLLVNTFIIEGEKLIIGKSLLHKYTTTLASVGDHGEHNHTVSDVLKKGDKVIVIPSADDNKFFVVDKVVI